jgi:tryptophanyl-tRNA synthetase
MTEFKEKSGLTEVQKEDVVNSIMERMEKAGLWEQVGQGISLEDQRRLLDIATGPFIDEIRGIVRQKTEHANASLLTYPVLMAADILLYDAQWVPVGEDQRQHLELTRNIAIRMNNKFGQLFTLPHEWSKQLEFSGQDRGVRVRSLRNPAKKMSKSIDDPSGTIMLRDEPEVAAQKIMSATTDSESVIRFDWEKQPGVTNLLQILVLLSNRPQAEIKAAWEGKSSYGELKSAVAETVRNYLADFQNRLKNVDQKQLLQGLEADEIAMRKVADNKLLAVQRAIGLRAH